MSSKPCRKMKANMKANWNKTDKLEEILRGKATLNIIKGTKTRKSGQMHL